MKIHLSSLLTCCFMNDTKKSSHPSPRTKKKKTPLPEYIHVQHATPVGGQGKKPNPPATGPKEKHTLSFVLPKWHLNENIFHVTRPWSQVYKKIVQRRGKRQNGNSLSRPSRLLPLQHQEELVSLVVPLDLAVRRGRGDLMSQK